MKPTGTQLWRWANKKIMKAEESGQGTQCPTLYQATRRFSCSYEDIENIISDLPEEGEYMDIGVAEGCRGGVRSLPRREQVIEAF